MSGKKTRLWVSSSGAVASTPLIEVEFQGDMSINTGKTAERTNFKNGATTAHGNAGWSASLTIGERIPLGTAQQILWDHHGDESALYMEVKGETGSVTYEGTVKVVITEDSAPVNGSRIFTVQLSEDGVVEQGVAA